MTEAWKDMQKAKEESYFDKKNREALKRLNEKAEEGKPRLSPITGKEMKQEVFHGVVIDRCEDSKGIWLDAGELEQIIQAIADEETGENWLTDFMKGLTGKG